MYCRTTHTSVHFSYIMMSIVTAQSFPPSTPRYSPSYVGPPADGVKLRLRSEMVDTLDTAAELAKLGVDLLPRHCHG